MPQPHLHALLFGRTCFAVSSNRYDNTAGGAIEVISPASSPVQSQQDKADDGQQAAGMMSKLMDLSI